MGYCYISSLPVQVLLEFPCELVSAVLAGRWAAHSTPVLPWMRGYWLRLIMAVLVTTLVCTSGRACKQCFQLCQMCNDYLQIPQRHPTA